MRLQCLIMYAFQLPSSFTIIVVKVCCGFQLIGFQVFGDEDWFSEDPCQSPVVWPRQQLTRLAERAFHLKMIQVLFVRQKILMLNHILISNLKRIQVFFVRQKILKLNHIIICNRKMVRKLFAGKKY